MKRDSIIDKDSLWGDVTRPYIMPKERSVDIDDYVDIKLAEILLKERRDESK